MNQQPPPARQMGCRRGWEGALYIVGGVVNWLATVGYIVPAVKSLAIVSGDSVDSQSLSDTLIVVGYITKILSAVTTRASYFSLRRASIFGLLEDGMKATQLDRALGLQQQGLQTALSSICVSVMPLAAFALSYALSGLAKKPFVLIPIAVSAAGSSETLYTNKGSPIGGGPSILSGVGTFNNVTAIQSINSTGYAVLQPALFIARDSMGAWYLHSVPGTALGLNTNPAIVGVSYNSTAVRFVPLCRKASVHDMGSGFINTAASPVGNIVNNDSTFWVQTFFNVGLRTGMNYTRFGGSGAICDVSGQTVTATFNFSRSGETWSATATNYKKATGSVSLFYPGAQLFSVPILISDLFTETLGQKLVETARTNQSLTLLGQAGMAATILFSTDYASPTNVSGVTISKIQGEILISKSGYTYAAAALFGLSGIVCFIAAWGALRQQDNARFQLTQLLAMSAGSRTLKDSLVGYCSGRKEYQGKVYVNLTQEAHTWHAQLDTEVKAPGKTVEQKLTTDVSGRAG